MEIKRKNNEFTHYLGPNWLTIWVRIYSLSGSDFTHYLGPNLLTIRVRINSLYLGPNLLTIWVRIYSISRSEFTHIMVIFTHIISFHIYSYLGLNLLTIWVRIYSLSGSEFTYYLGPNLLTIWVRIFLWNIWFKDIVSLISSDPPCKFTTEYTFNCSLNRESSVCKPLE